MDNSIGDRATMPRRVGAAEGLSGERSLGERDTLPGQAAAPAGRRFRIGDVVLGRYRVTGELGQGGMGVVYRCFDETAGIDVALKALPHVVARDSGEMEEVRENFRLVAGLVHQNIASVKTLERDPATGDVFLIMECVDGINLRQWRKREGCASADGQRVGGVVLERVLPVLRQAAAALDFAHGQKIIHRDVKPANIMLRSDGVVKVLDFGLAAQIHTSLSRASQVRYGTSGTGPYMATEQWEGRRQDARTDQYALAVTAYELLAGRCPFENHDPAVLRQSVLKTVPEPVPGLTRAQNAALLRGLAKEPAARYTSCGEFAAALGKGKERTTWPYGVLLAAALGLGGYQAYRSYKAYFGKSEVPSPPVKIDIVAPDPEEVQRQAKKNADEAAEAKGQRDAQEYLAAKAEYERQHAQVAELLKRSGGVLWVQVEQKARRGVERRDTQQGASAYREALEGLAAAVAEARAAEGKEAQRARLSQAALEEARAAQKEERWDAAEMQADSVLKLEAGRPGAAGQPETPQAAEARRILAHARQKTAELKREQEEARRLKDAQDYRDAKADFERAYAQSSALLKQYGGVLWGQVERLCQKAEAAEQDDPVGGARDYQEALKRLPAAVEAAKVEVVRQKDAQDYLAAKADYGREFAPVGALLKQYGGALWKQVEQKVLEGAEKGDTQQGAGAYREAQAGLAGAVAEAREAERREARRAQQSAAALDLARAALKAGRWDEAKTQADSVLKLEAGRPFAAGPQKTPQEVEAGKLYEEAERESRKAVTIAEALATAQAAKRSGDWKAVVKAAEEVLALSPGHLAAAALKAEAEQNLPPSVCLKTLLEGREVAAKVVVGSTSFETPKSLTVRDGGQYKPLFTMNSGGRLYRAEMPFTVNWKGAKTFTVELREVREPIIGEAWVSPLTGMEFVWVKELELWVGKYEVTNGEYRRYNPRHTSLEDRGGSLDGDRQPVVYVSFEDAKAYAEWMSEKERWSAKKYQYRVISEKEWLACARCGTDREFPWGSKKQPTRGNYADLAAVSRYTDWRVIDGYNDGFAVSCPVERSGENEWGLFGIGGNVSEACASRSSGSSFGAWRGASWLSLSTDSLKCDQRETVGGAQSRNKAGGFRLVLTL